MASTSGPANRSLRAHSIEASAQVYWNLTPPLLYTHALRNNEGVLAEGGALVVDTRPHTGRSPDDKFLVSEPGSAERIWVGKVNRPLSEEHFGGLRAKVCAHLAARDLHVVDAYVGADPDHRLSVRVVTATAYHALFSRTMF